MSSAARIEELQKKFDENPRRYFAPLANECRKAGDLDAAIAICRTHLPQQPGHMSGHIVYGQALFESGELDEARTVFETALGLDPENLIALRHMGDIAARHGDIAAARQWYVRVLETDPRNEEIQSLVSGLGQQPAAPVAAGQDDFPAHGSVPPEPAFDAAGFEAPSDAGDFAASGSAAPDDAGDFAASGSFDEPPADLDDGPRVRGGLPSLVDPALLAAAAEAVPDDAVPEPDVEPVDASGSFEPELVELDDAGFDAGRLHTTETEAAAAADTPRDELLEPTVMEFDTPSVDAGTLEGLEATTFEPPAADEVTQFERVGDEALLDGIDASAPRLEGLESAEFDASGYGGSGLESIAAPSFDFEPVDAGPLQDPPTPTPTPLPPAPPPAPPSGEAFVTETMAELYLRQGYRDEAMGVYRKLVSQSPDDAALRSRMERVERELAVDAEPGVVPAPDSMEADGDDLIAGLPRAIEPALVAAAAEAGPDAAVLPARPTSGPTIREFLSALATGAPVTSHQPEGEIADVVDLGRFEVTDSGYDAPEPAATDPVGGLVEAEVLEPAGESHLIDAAAAGFDAFEPEPLGAPEAEEPAASALPAAPATPAGEGLDALFGTPDREDERAADMLAAAYLPPAATAEAGPAEPAEPAADPLRGRPARPAGNDLSLDHVFGAPRQQGSPRNTGGFSFDQFFAEGAVKPAREDAPDQPGAAGDEEDLEQFNSWLHNLRKP